MSAVKVLVNAATSLLEIQSLRKASAAPATEAEAQPAAEAKEEAAVEAAPVQEKSAAAAVEATAGLSKNELEVHKKAKRFAKLLVDEIKLYNKEKVAEGRQNKDIYQRLKDDIEKSRSTYEKRYGGTSAASAGYFQSEAVRILADDDDALMGPGFQQ